MAHPRKLEALLTLARGRPGDAPLMFLLGFLAARLEQLRFVRDLSGHEVAIHLVDPGTIVWPGRGFRGRIGGVEIADPVAMAVALASYRGPVAVRLDLAAPPAWYAELLHEEDHAAASREDRAEQLKRRVDQALDFFNEARRALEAGAGSREGELRFLLELARREAAELSRELSRLAGEARPAGRSDQTPA